MEIVGYFMTALVGISLGLIGGGGSILTVPILVYLMGINPVLATSYSLFIVGSTSMVGATISYRNGLVKVKTALFFGLSSIATVFLIRRFIMPAIPDILFKTDFFSLSKSVTIMVLFALLMLFAAVAMIRDKKVIEADSKPFSEMGSKVTSLLSYGVLIGTATGFLGAGGGFLLIPALVLIFKIPMKEAVGTSLLIIALNSIIGFAADYGHYIINWKFLISIALIAITGIFIGTFISKKADGEKLKKAFGWFVFAMGLYILMHELFFHT